MYQASPSILVCNLVCILLEGQEGTLDLVVGLGELDQGIAQADVTVLPSLPGLPSLLTLTAGDGTRLGAVLVAEGATASSQDHVGVAQVLEEGRQMKSVHPARDDGSCLLYALPLLLVECAIGLVVLQHQSSVLVGRVALHLAEAHGACVDAGCTDNSGGFGARKGGVAELSLVFLDVGVGHASIDQERTGLRQGSELGQNVCASGNHLVGICCDVGAEQLADASLVNANSH